MTQLCFLDIFHFKKGTWEIQRNLTHQWYWVLTEWKWWIFQFLCGKGQSNSFQLRISDFLKLDFLRPANSENVHPKIWLESSLLKKMRLYWRIKQKDMGNYRTFRCHWFQTKKKKPYFTGLRIKSLKET